MNNHNQEQLGAHVLGLLNDTQAGAVDEHLADCAPCRRNWEELREMTNLLGEVPSEAFLEGPPDGDLVLQRTLRQMRAENGAHRRRRSLTVVAAAAVALAAVLGGGVVVGRTTAPDAVLAQPETPAGTRVLQGGDAGITMAATLTPAAGWVRLTATVQGIPAGEVCNLVVVSRDGTRQVAGSWVVSPAGEPDGTTLNGSAAVAPDQVRAVLVENEAGRRFVEVRA